MRTAICTVGTSLSSNYNRIVRPQELPDQKVLLHFLNEHEITQACAEGNSLKRLMNEDKLRQGDRIIFLHSATAEGALCGDALTEYYSLCGFTTKSVEIAGLNYEHKQFRNSGLKSLVDTLVKLLDRYASPSGSMEEPCMIVATGGFKAEVAYATLTGISYRVPVYYIHEKFDGIVEIPPLPISWDISLVAEYEDLFIELSNMLEERKWKELLRKQLSKHNLTAIPSWLPSIIMREDGMVYLSPAGELLYGEFRRNIQSIVDRRIYLSAQALKSLESLDTSVRRRCEKKMLQLLEQRFRNNAKSKRNSDLLVYPQGGCPERIFFYADEDEVYVYEISSHSDQSYEKLLSRGVWRVNYQSLDFKEHTLPEDL